MLAADADPLLPVAASPCETPWRLERPRPSQRQRTRHILILPHGRPGRGPRHLASATPPHRQHPAISLLVLPPLIFLVLYRFPFAAPRTWRRNAVVYTLLTSHWSRFTARSRRFWASAQWRRCYSLSCAGEHRRCLAIAPQHQFDGTHWARHVQWDPVDAALRGSSFLRLPRLLQWAA